ncbi:MAG TPA: M23 family metallopeptidase [Gemmatimonadaceae bacterium]|nr:M23 family metallopeptidase [Gemmatimonadaceae bacterium]
MRRPSRRVVVVAVVVAVAAGLLMVGLPHPRMSTPFAPTAAAAPADPAPPAEPVWRTQADTLRTGQTVSGLLSRSGLASGEIANVLSAATALDARHARAGMPIIVRSRTADSIPSEIIFKLAVDRLLHIRRTDSGWTSIEVRLPWTSDTVVVSGTINSNLYDAIDSAAPALPRAVRTELAWSLADIYEYRVDMSRDLREGDSFRALFVRQQGPGGAERVGDVLAARFTFSGDTTEAFRFVAGADSDVAYYDQDRKSLRAEFLRVPLQFRRISSVFGRRFHPILKRWREHTGIDYAANAGTPVRAIGSGTVIYAGRMGGYGNAIDIRHANGFVSRYGHMRAFAHGIHRGVHVTIGQTIGYVGMTGLATGPHLHFEIRVNGVARDPRVVLKNNKGFPIPKGDLARFDQVRHSLLLALNDTGRARQLAAR